MTSMHGLQSTQGWRTIGWCVALVLCSACYRSTQRYPSFMESETVPLPVGARDAFQRGPEEVLVVRISDPVHISRPGDISSFPLYYFRKQLRLNAGSWVFSGAGGRAELLYGDSSRILLFDVTSGVVGSASRGEPMFFFEELSRASVTMENPEQVRFLGGAIKLQNAPNPCFLRLRTVLRDDRKC